MEIVDGVNADFDATGGIVGFDIDHASRHLDVSTLEAEAPGILQRVSDRRHPEAVHVETGKDFLRVFLADGRGIAVPLSWYPRLCHGTAEEAKQWTIPGEGRSISWPGLDEDIGVCDLLDGFPSGESARSYGRWLQARKQNRGLIGAEIEDHESSAEFRKGTFHND